MELAYPKTRLVTFFSDVKDFFFKKNLDFLLENDENLFCGY